MTSGRADAREWHLILHGDLFFMASSIRQAKPHEVSAHMAVLLCGNWYLVHMCLPDLLQLKLGTE